MERLYSLFTNKLSALLLAFLLTSTAALATPLQIYGSWHCGNDACTWGTVRDMTDFDAKNHWLIDRGDGVPSVNLVVLSFVDPLKLLNKTKNVRITGPHPAPPPTDPRHRPGLRPRPADGASNVF